MQHYPPPPWLRGSLNRGYNTGCMAAHLRRSWSFLRVGLRWRREDLMTPGRVKWIGRPTGQDNDDVYRRLLGFTKADMDNAVCRGDRGSGQACRCLAQSAAAQSIRTGSTPTKILAMS